VIESGSMHCRSMYVSSPRVPVHICTQREGYREPDHAGVAMQKDDVGDVDTLFKGPKACCAQ
jgi:hypothetical protein